jgi:cyclopropane fatty-acyl-phospholipid synthase-like methyltransferase
VTNPWNEIFRERGRVFLDPHEDIPEIAKTLEERRAERLLDLGSGTGRHVVYFARRGLSVWGLDNSLEALRAAEAWLSDEGLHATLVEQSMLDPLPFKDGFFDAVISIQVIHHASYQVVGKAKVGIMAWMTDNGI